MVQCVENKTNAELNSLIRNKNVIKYIKAQRLSWFGHVDRMEKLQDGKKIIGLAGRTKIRWGKTYKRCNNYENK
jgi:hypothetical protein